MYKLTAMPEASGNEDPAQKLNQDHSQKEGKGQSASPHRSPLVQISNLQIPTVYSATAKTSAALPTNDSPGDVGPNARRWAAQGRATSVSQAAGTVLVKEHEVDSGADPAWNHWLEKGDAGGSETPAQADFDPGFSLDSAMSIPDQESAAKGHTASVAVSSVGGTVEIPSEFGDVSDAPKLEQPGEVSERQSASILKIPVSGAAESSSVIEAPAGIASSPKVQDQDIHTHRETSKVGQEVEFTDQEEEDLDTVAELPSLASPLQKPQHHRRVSSMIGGPVYMRGSHKAKLPSADIGALQLHEYFSPLSLGLLPEIELPALSVFHSSAPVQQMPMQDGQKNFQHTGAAMQANTHGSQDHTERTSSHSPTSDKSSGSAVSLEDRSQIVSEDAAPYGAPRSTFQSRPYRPLSAEDKSPLDSLPGSPDPFSKTGDLSQWGAAVERKNVAAHTTFSDVASNITSSVDVSFAAPQSSVSLDHKLLSCESRPSSAQSTRSKFRWAEKISKLTDSCVGRSARFDTSPDQKKSFTPLSDSVSASDWEKGVSRGGPPNFASKPVPFETSTALHWPALPPLKSNLSLPAKRTQPDASLNSSLSRADSGASTRRARAQSVLPLEIKLAKAGVKFDDETDDDIIKAIHSSISHRL